MFKCTETYFTGGHNHMTYDFSYELNGDKLN